ncbi:MAG: DUF3089 domain-containing protein [Propionibacteriaceae bacterium]|jgi:hypothetical protein|nr:DUF3089 domain-containing protein [Propionibacteriaceae bacterium]
MEALDYSDPRNWFLAPGERRLDGVPDVFVIAPTVCFDESGPVYVDPDDPAFHAGLAEFAEIAVHPVFDDLAVNVWMPKYRMVNGARFDAKGPDATLLFLDPDDGGLQAPLLDAFAAFAQFIGQRNADQWYVLWSHSQGSIVNGYLTTAFMPNALGPAELSRMGANYLIGWGLNQAILANSPYPASTSPTDTGTIISWNTATRCEVAAKTRATWGDATTTAVNPLTFDQTTRAVAADANPGGVLRYFEAGPLREVRVGARLVRPSDEGGPFPGLVVEVDLDEHAFRDEASIAGQDAAALGYTHHWDISLFSESLKANLRARLGIAPAG